MASGLLGKANLTAGANNLLYTVPAGKVATINVRVANRAATAVAISVAIGTGGAPTDQDWITYSVNLPTQAILEDTGIVCSEGEKVWVKTDVAGVSARIHGFEE